MVERLININKKENMEELRFWVPIVIIFAVVAGRLNLPKWIIDSIITKIVLGPILGIATGTIAGIYAESLDKLTNGILKEWTFERLGIEISVQILVIVTLIIELALFS